MLATTTRPAPALGTTIEFLTAMATGRISIQYGPVVSAAGCSTLVNASGVVCQQRSKPFVSLDVSLTFPCGKSSTQTGGDCDPATNVPFVKLTPLD
jgi:hypothetical protein